jgi:hypothetical protein
MKQQVIHPGCDRLGLANYSAFKEKQVGQTDFVAGGKFISAEKRITAIYHLLTYRLDWF